MYSKLYTFIAVFGLVTAQKGNEEWTYYASIIMAAAVCWIVTYFRDYKKVEKPDWLYTLSCSTAASYMAYFLFPYMKDVEMDLLIVKFHPFNPIQMFVGICSYFGITIFTEANAIKTFGWKNWVAALGDKLKAIGEKKNE